MVATVTGTDDVTVLEPESGVSARSEVGITGVAGKSGELLGESDAVALCEAAGPADVLPATVLPARDSRFAG